MRKFYPENSTVTYTCNISSTFFNRDENTCFGWNPKSKRLVFLGASALHVKFILVELMLAKH